MLFSHGIYKIHEIQLINLHYKNKFSAQDIILIGIHIII